MSIFTTRTTCRSCGASELDPVLSLGETPLANALLSDVGGRDECVPLDVVFCRRCALVQIIEDVPPELLFRDYVYLSSFSDTTVANARSIAERLIEERKLTSRSLVIEIASNDGYLLRHYVWRGVSVLGIEPARNIAELTRRQHIETIDEFFTLDLAAKLAGRADVVHANNVLAHVADLNGFVQGIRVILKPGGIASIEVPYVREMIDHLEFDTIYHEHLCYFSLTALDSLFSRHGLTIGRVERLPIHGGSLRIFSGCDMPRDESVARLLDEEREWGVSSPSSYQRFGERVRALGDELRSTLQRLKSEGKRIAAYGASAKGTTLLTFVGIGGETLDFVADRSTVKQGKLTPGTHLPIVGPEELEGRMPDYVLMLVWNFADEVLRQQEEYRRRGGKFIIPIPKVTIV
jgi:SAM-dependent methyltransferase